MIPAGFLFAGKPRPSACQAGSFDQLNNTAILAPDDGFEPPQAESKSGVLPLH